MELLDAIDDQTSVSAVVLLPWSPTEADEWIGRWGATELATGKAIPLSMDALPPDLQAELSRLTAIVNLSTGISHPGDAAHARRILTPFRGRGIDAACVRSWLVRHDWRTADAAEVSGKYFKS